MIKILMEVIDLMKVSTCWHGFSPDRNRSADERSG